MASLILVVNVVGELQRKRTLAASCGFLAAARLSCNDETLSHRALQKGNACRTEAILKHTRIIQLYTVCAVYSSVYSVKTPYLSHESVNCHSTFYFGHDNVRVQSVVKP